MIGPAYSYAYIEFFDLPRILSPDGKALILGCEFNASHPSHIFRLQQQIALLKDLGWWPHVRKIKSHYSDVLQSIDTIDKAKFAFTQSENPGRAGDALPGFLLLCPHIHAVLTSTLSTLVSGLDGFEEHEKEIREYLSRAVVPSTIVRDGVMYYPDPVAIVNASYGLHLEALTGLIDHIEDQDTTSVRTRAQWIDRLELWTTKAIEDHGLLVKQPVI
jgi:hypothetical protein